MSQKNRKIEDRQPLILVIRKNGRILDASPTDVIQLAPPDDERLVGRFDWQHIGREDLLGVLRRQAIDVGINKAIFDFVKCSFLASSDLRDLIAIHNDLKPRGVELVLANLNSNVREVLEILKLDRFFVTCGSMDEAVKHLSRDK
ncbi:MAG: STAS domain-containing protein [Pirellulaceae bacterium]